MECEAVLLLLWEYLDEELGAEVAAAMAEHLSRCECCYPVYCCDRAFLQLLNRQKERCPAPPPLRIAIQSKLSAG